MKIEHYIPTIFTSSQVGFEFKEVQEYFENLLCSGSQTIEHFRHLFDFRPVNEKREDFNKDRKKLKGELISKYGEQCMLNLSTCNMKSGTAIDHLIPLSTNQLNKSFRKLKPLQKWSDCDAIKPLLRSTGTSESRALVLQTNTRIRDRVSIPEH